MKVWLKKFLLSISTLLPITLLQVPISAEDLVREDVVIKADNVIEKEDMDEIDYGIINSSFEKEFDEIVEFIYEMRDKGISFEEIDDKLDKNTKIDEFFTVKENDAITIKSEVSIQGLPLQEKNYNYANLNSREKALYNKNKAKALVCMANGKYAIKYSKELYKSSVLHNGNGDAFRHAIWNYGMAIDVGQTFAKQWADAHEYGDTKQPYIERKMDLHNNMKGRSLAKQYPYTRKHFQFKNNTKKLVRSGKCFIIKNGKIDSSSSYGEK